MNRLRFEPGQGRETITKPWGLVKRSWPWLVGTERKSTGKTWSTRQDQPVHYSCGIQRPVGPSGGANRENGANRGDADTRLLAGQGLTKTTKEGKQEKHGKAFELRAKLGIRDRERNLV